MSKRASPLRIIVCCIAICGVARGQGSLPTAPQHAGAPDVGRFFVIPGTSYAIVLHGALAPGTTATGALPSNALMRAIEVWLADNFELPPAKALPKVQLVSASKIAVFHYTGRLSDTPADLALVPQGAREVLAGYDPRSDTIYLPERWAARSPAEVSMLVFEMAHHLQRHAQRRYACPAARDELPYAAQDKWLHMFGEDLAGDFDIDGFTLVVTTSCGP